MTLHVESLLSIMSKFKSVCDPPCGNTPYRGSALAKLGFKRGFPNGFNPTLIKKKCFQGVYKG